MGRVNTKKEKFEVYNLIYIIYTLYYLKEGIKFITRLNHALIFKINLLFYYAECSDCRDFKRECLQYKYIVVVSASLIVKCPSFFKTNKKLNRGLLRRYKNTYIVLEFWLS